MEHWYGLPEALFEDRTVQNYPLDYNYQNEQHRFGEAGKLWKQAAVPYSDHWNNVMSELIDLDLQWFLPLIYMKQVETFTALEELNGTKIIPCHHYGDFSNQVKFHMDLIGIFGEQNRRLLGKRIIIYG